MTESTTTTTTTTTTTKTRVGFEYETIQRQHGPNDSSIIPRLWSEDLHDKWFASSGNPSELARTITVLSPPTSDIAATIRSRPISRRDSQATATASTSTSTSTNASTSTSSSTTSSTTSSSISSTHLGSKLAGDVLVAATVTFGVSPFLTVVDKAIVESASGTNSIVRSALNSLKSMARNPIEYFRSPTFLLMWGVYSSTYSTANAFKTLEEHATYRRDRSQTSTTTSGCATAASAAGTFAVASFLGTTVVNSGTSMLKDRAYARMFSGASSSSSSTRPFPKASYALWAMRDLSVIGSSFLLPDLVAAKLASHPDLVDLDPDRAKTICQIGLPVLAQFVAGPFQYLGLDVYNRNLSHLSAPAAVADRARQLAGGIAPVVAARVARIVPGYSIGGVANTKLRTEWREGLLERDVAAMMKQQKPNGTKSNNSNNEYATRMVALLHGSSQQGDTKKSN